MPTEPVELSSKFDQLRLERLRSKQCQSKLAQAEAPPYLPRFKIVLSNKSNNSIAQKAII